MHTDMYVFIYHCIYHVQSLMDQPDYLVVGCLGMQAVGKSTVMSILAGTKTGSGRSVEHD